MKLTLTLLTALLLVPLAAFGGGDVSIAELTDRIQVKVGDQIFTEWRHKEWVAPFLYPVVGPNGENVTRHYPIKAGVPGEEPDHPWHRSIRFSHSDVNGFNFWWSPGKEKAGHTAEIKLEKIEKITSGKTGEVIFWNQWLGDGKLVLREKVRLTFMPMENRQLLMDYDTELQAADAPVVFGDKRDGGLLVRVAGTMKVESEKGEKGSGCILNSRGDKDATAWGKRAEWTDYCGPDASGKTVGIAIFDHPSNIRFPTHWHARKYGLLAANRFGNDHFQGKYDDHKTIVCRPAGDSCPACASHSGDYTIPAGKSISLKHRLYFHHGDSSAAGVPRQYSSYTSDPAAILSRMHALQQDRQWKLLIDQFSNTDFATWSGENVQQASEALLLRGQSFAVLKEISNAERDFQSAVELTPKNPAAWILLGDFSVQQMPADERALAAYRQALALAGQGNGWQSMHATIAIARLLTDHVRTDEALEILKPYQDRKETPINWRIRFLRAYGQVYAAQGEEAKSLQCFREALELEAKP
jgi:predicted negative regulator of RcsB-dependent stress response